jgi:hypothetical protein
MMMGEVLRLTPEDHQRWRDMVEASGRAEEQRRLDREAAIKLQRDEERRAIAEEEQRRRESEERIAARTAALVVGALARSRLESAPEPPPQLPKPVEQATGSEPGDDQVFTVDQICERNKISRSTFYKHGPVSYKAGKSTRITRREERLWQQRQREAASHGNGL